MSEKIKCSNCGAEFDKNETKCPYCGYINEEGAEKEYMDRLYDVRDSLDVVDEAAAADYGRGYGRVFKIIALTLLVLTVLAGIIYTVKVISDKRSQGDDLKKSSDMLEEMTWKKENFKIFDDMYAQGKYEELCEALLDAIEDGHEVYDWEHYDFAMVYYDYVLIERDAARVDEKGWTDHTAADLFYHCCLFHYDEEFRNGSYYKLTDEEFKILEPGFEYSDTVLHDRMGFTDEEMQELKGELLSEYGYPEYKKCEKTAHKYMERFK